MEILKRFERYVEDNKLFSKDEKILVAVSGGRDSMLLLWLLHQLYYPVEIAHCNFQLRGEESDADEQLVRGFAVANEIPIHVQRFDTTGYAATHKVSIQIAARELRYGWFERLRMERGCKVIAVAQHMNDSVETVLFNLSRGTGLQGLQGILPLRDDSHVVRPLLFLHSEEITDFVQNQGIPYRDDSSNFSNKYARNKIRLDIIPEFEQLNPHFIRIMADNIARFRDAQEVINNHMQELRSQIMIARSDHSWRIAKEELEHLQLSELYFMFEPFGFSKTVLQDLLESLHKDSGKQFASDTYIIVTDREDVILSKKNMDLEPVHIDLATTRVEWGAFQIEITGNSDLAIENGAGIAKIDTASLVYPLTIRQWEEGDTFQPLGMNGKKKLSNYFIQKKINILDKKRVPILVNGDGKIIWVVNYHLDERFKIRDNTQKVLKLVCNLK